MLLCKQCKAVVTSINSVNRVNSKNSVNSAVRPPSLMVFFPVDNVDSTLHKRSWSEWWSYSTKIAWLTTLSWQTKNLCLISYWSFGQKYIDTLDAICIIHWRKIHWSFGQNYIDTVDKIYIYTLDKNILILSTKV